MKKIAAILLVVCLLLGACVGCGDRSDPGSAPQKSPSSSLGVIDSPSVPFEANGDAALEPETADDPPTVPQEENTPSGSSQEPENLPEENTLYFTLGPDSEAKAIRPGDTLGGWTLESWDVNWNEEINGTPWVDGAVFTAPADAPVELRCTVYLSPMATEDRTYWFDVAEEDYDKMPMIKGVTANPTFRAVDNAALVALEDMGIEDRWECRIAVSRYIYFYLPRAVTDAADVVRLELE